MSALYLIIGITLLAFAGDALVRGSIEVAHRLQIPQIVIGLTIVAFGTSAPELIVSIQAAFAGAPGLSIGNVVGSNIANSMLVLGLPAIIAPIVLSGAGIRRSFAFMATMTVVLFLVVVDLQVTRIEGSVLMVLLVIYLSYSAIAANGERTKSILACTGEEEESENPLSPKKIALFIAFGIVGLGVGGKLTTDGALGIAQTFGLENSAVGLTIVALGTSLPEVAASVSAAFRRQTGVIIGNVIGSNIFNILGIVGITAILVPLDVSYSIVKVDMWIVAAVTAVMIPIIFKTRCVTRRLGIVMTCAYITYSVLTLHNGMTLG